MPSSTDVQRLMDLFQGLEQVHGTHGVPDLEGLKWTIKRTARTIREPATLELWIQHVEGKRPIGIVPIMSNNTCWWGSIDVDQYDGDMIEVANRACKMFPFLVPCFSKSGGLHLFVFFKEPAPAELVQKVLKSIAAALGLANSEIFPKQTQLLIERGDAGSWMVMPYFGGTFGNKLRMQVGVKRTGAEMSLGEFLDEAERAASTTLAEFVEINARPVAPPKARRAHPTGAGAGGGAEGFSDGPRCLEIMVQAGPILDGRNRSLFHMGVYLKKAHPNEWQYKMSEYNQRYMSPPLEHGVVEDMIKTLGKEEYQYRCKEEPMCSHCDVSVCQLRKYGVGDGDGFMDARIDAVTIILTDPKTYIVTTPGGTVVVEMSQFHNQSYFSQACGEQVRVLPWPQKHADWLRAVSTSLREANEVEPVSTLKPGAEFWELAATFFLNKTHAQRREEILLGMPWFAGEGEDARTAGWHYCDGPKFLSWLWKEGGGLSEKVKRPQIVEWFESRGGETDHPLRIPVGAKPKKVWRVPAAAFADEEVTEEQREAVVASGAKRIKKDPI